MDKQQIKAKLDEFSDIITSIKDIISEEPVETEWEYINIPSLHETGNFDTSIDKLYTVVEYYKNNDSKECEVCGGTGLVVLDDTFRHHYKRCSCKELEKSYCVHIVPVDYYDTENQLYVCKDRKIPSSSVHDYHTEDLGNEVRLGAHVFYESQEEAERCIEDLVR